MTRIKVKTKKKESAKKVIAKKAPAKKVPVKKAPAKKAPAKKVPTKKVIAKKKPIKKAPSKKTEPKIIPAKKWDEGGVDIVKKTHNRLNRPYSVNICATSSGTVNFPFGDDKTLVEPKKEISKSKLQKFIEKAEKIVRKRHRKEPLKLSTFNELVKEELDRIIDEYNTRKTIDEVLKDRFAPNPSGKREINVRNIDLSDFNTHGINLFCESIFKEKNDKQKERQSFNSQFKLKSNGKYNVGKLKGLNIINKDGYAPLKVLILTLDKDEIKLLKNGLPIKFILEK